MQKKVGNLFATAYLLLIFGIYPLYMRQGYVDIGEAKFQFFICCSLAGAGILFLSGMIDGLQKVHWRWKQKESCLIRWDRLSVTDLFVMMFGTVVFLSYVLSDYRQEALWGTEGWNMGAVLWLALCLLYFLISRLWDGKELICHVIMAVSAIVYFLCILDRFSFYLIPIEIRDPAFISTLGNINWVCGYFSVIAPVGICTFLFSGEKIDKETNGRETGRRIISGIYTVTAFMAGFCQGGDSIFLFYGALFYILLWIAIKKRSRIRNYFLLVSLWGFSAQAIRIMRILLPGRYNYDTDNLCAFMTDSNMTLAAGLIFLLCYLFSSRNKKEEKEDLTDVQKVHLFHKIMVFALGGGILIWLGLAVWNTQKRIPLLEGKSLFLLNESWGNGRGAALKAGFSMFKEMPVLNKLIGVGPDCFSSYAYSLPEIAMDIRDSFGSSRLTNAHNELLTSMVNTGMAGTFLYLGIFVSFIIRMVKRGESRELGCTAAVCAFCYLLHNMISFAQVLNLPFVFLIMAMGEKNASG